MRMASNKEELIHKISADHLQILCCLFDTCQPHLRTLIIFVKHIFYLLFVYPFQEHVMIVAFSPLVLDLKRA